MTGHMGARPLYFYYQGRDWQRIKCLEPVVSLSCFCFETSPKNRNFEALFPIKKSTIILLIRLFETMNQETLFGSLFRNPNQEPFVVSLPISVSRGIQFDRSGERSSTFAPGTRLVLRCEDGAKPFPKSRAKCRCHEEKCAWSKLHKTQCLTL